MTKNSSNKGSHQFLCKFVAQFAGSLEVFQCFLVISFHSPNNAPLSKCLFGHFALPTAQFYGLVEIR